MQLIIIAIVCGILEGSTPSVADDVVRAFVDPSSHFIVGILPRTTTDWLYHHSLKCREFDKVEIGFKAEKPPAIKYRLKGRSTEPI